MTPQAEPFLLAQFREFYREVVRLKRRVGRDAWVFEGDEPSDEAEEGSDPRSPSAVWQRLLTLLERQASSARRAGGEFGERFYHEAQYIMAALADEVFLHLDWRGRESWKSNLIESKLFNTHHAGEAVFQRLDEILSGRDPIHLDLAKVYLMALALGFQGKFRDAEGGGQRLADYREEILEFVSEREPRFRDGSKRLFGKTYANTLDRGEGQTLPYLRPWLLGFGAVLVLWILVGHGLWMSLTGDLFPIIETILE